MLKQCHAVRFTSAEVPHSLPAGTPEYGTPVRSLISAQASSEIASWRRDLLLMSACLKYGVIFFRMPAATVEIKIERLKDILAEYPEQLDAFLVVTEKRVRVSRPQ